MQVLLTGATGFLGAHLVRRLGESGHEVRAMVRASSDTEPLARTGVELVRATFGDESSLRRAIDGVDAIVHAAGGGLGGSAEAVWAANAGSTRALLAAGGSEVRRFVLVSSLAAHGPSEEGRPATERDPDAPRSVYGKSKLDAERAVLSAGAHGPVQVVIVRPPALYGPGEHRMVPLFRAARRGVLPMVHARGTTSFLHGADCADAIVRALDAPEARGLYYVAEPRAYERRELAEAIGAALERTVRVVDVPVPALRIAAGALELAARAGAGRSLLTADRVLDLEGRDQACDAGRARRELGWETRRELASGMREALADYRARGWI